MVTGGAKVVAEALHQPNEAKPKTPEAPKKPAATETREVEAHAALVEQLRRPVEIEPRLDLINSPWLNHLSQKQAETLAGLNLTPKQREFLTQMIFVARQVYAEGYNINLAGMVAQGTWEGGWKVAPNFANWGVKGDGYSGPTQVFPKASEWNPQLHKDVTQPGVFRAYDSLLDAGRDYGREMSYLYRIAAAQPTIKGFAETIQHEPYLEKDNKTIAYRRYATGKSDDGMDYARDLIELAEQNQLEALVAIPTEEFTP
jgi:flagellum-specific peptidoglycan hydrolase FlgJ